MLEIDEVSLLASVDTDFPVAELEGRLQRQGFTLNYFAWPDNQALLAEALSRRLPNLYGPAFGGIEDLALQVKWAQAGGEVFTNVATPRAAAGPSFKKLAIGSGEWLGLPIQAVLRIFPKPAVRERLFAAFVREEGLQPFLRALQRSGRALPLSATLKTSIAAEHFSDLGLFEAVWGGEAWGSGEEVAAIFEEIEVEILAKGGRLLEWRGRSSGARVGDILFASAVGELQLRIQQASAKLSGGQLRLMARLKEGV